jgi:predicted aldo/keto reductase-like oxidoreductase
MSMGESCEQDVMCRVINNFLEKGIKDFIETLSSQHLSASEFVVLVTLAVLRRIGKI